MDVWERLAYHLDKAVTHGKAASDARKAGSFSTCEAHKRKAQAQFKATVRITKMHNHKLGRK